MESISAITAAAEMMVGKERHCLNKMVQMFTPLYTHTLRTQRNLTFSGDQKHYMGPKYHNPVASVSLCKIFIVFL